MLNALEGKDSFYSKEPAETQLPVAPHLFWYCSDCHEVFRPLPMEEPQEEGVPDERLEFLQSHRFHRLGILRRVAGKVLSNRPFWDPMRVTYEEVSSGRQTFVLKSWREDITLPRQYVLLQGCLKVEENSLSLDEELLRESLGACLVLEPEALERLLRVMRETVAAFSPEELLGAYGSGEETDLSFAYLSDRQWDLLLRRCSRVVDPSQRGLLEAAFRSWRYEEELMVAVRQKLHLCSS